MAREVISTWNKQTAYNVLDILCSVFRHHTIELPSATYLMGIKISCIAYICGDILYNASLNIVPNVLLG